ncbi:16S rRNA (guanine(966)-N(2))-methyltransferase RsmD [Desulfohalotomaculum tongense]|uniref:16S rRNA (guanine(966)-N(2))-methyltransferase RsmD n=1 Tax=Desulforadius tongensis TaxID=1216062 RepID=UPI00195CDB8E|nr:16S rRNA (guanine(966)-N(2))-methyltransferase RsmD [Desulforadius tongensis]MBM7856195.1 16S rRNA (guanine(966)-N(2))-methyltransferase RsmD [Desulforadius tongensis]
MRVIAGSAKKTLLKSPKGKNTRPTADRVKESVFNILSSRVLGSVFLDLFAGSGAMAIEALSRGAEQAVLVERDYRNVKLIKENLRITKLWDRAEILGRDVFQAIKNLGQDNKKFDIIYIDPPYRAGYYQKVLEEIVDCDLICRGGIVVVESSKQLPPPETVKTISRVRTQKYGDTMVSFYQKSQQ